MWLYVYQMTASNPGNVNIAIEFIIDLLAGLGSRCRSQSQVFLAPFSNRSRLKKKQEPEPAQLGKKVGARASKKFTGSSAQLEDKKHNKIVLFLLFFR